jgi:hypothetical protein
MVKCEHAAADIERLEEEIDARKRELGTQMAIDGPEYLVKPEE